MADAEIFGLAVLLTALAGTLAVLSNRVSERLRVPAPAIFLIGAAVVSDIWPSLGRVPGPTVEQIVTIALAVILFDGGMHIGRRRFFSAAGATIWLGVVGTLLTAGAVALLAHYLLGIHWLVALLLGTALAPTDPAVVFSVLGRREIAGRTGTLIEAESGANDPVGVALLVALLAATGGDTAFGPAAVEITVQFVEQMAIGCAIGAAGGLLLLSFMRRVPLPSEGLYALRVLFGALAIYGLAAVAHGSGFLAVFVAGIVLGDERAPYKREIERFHASLASLAEIVAFVLLGLTVSLRDLDDGGAWWLGLVLAAALAFVIRPVLVGLLLWPVRLRLGERVFVLWTGLKGAVPVLLGTFIVASGAAEGHLMYEIIFVVVAFSVIVQGGLVPELARRLRIPLRVVEPEPWSLGVRFQEEPGGLHRFTVAPGSAAEGTTIENLPCGEEIWVSFVLREGRLVPVRSETELRSGDEVLVLAEAEDINGLAGIFEDKVPRGGSTL